MTSDSFRFDGFVIDLQNRQLRREGVPVELNARYFDALALLVREPGKLVSKDRFIDEVWRGVPVTDEALTQCIRTLRRQLGDDASHPRFIETVVKHGYRFIASVESAESEPSLPEPSLPESSLPVPPLPEQPAAFSKAQFLTLGGAGTLGALAAGLAGGLIYGFAAAQPGLGTISVLLVILCLTLIIALMGGAAVSIGIVAANLVFGRVSAWSIAGGAIGGMVIGALVKLLGLDAFNLLFGRAPGDITGAPEGALLGGAVGLGAWLMLRGAGRSFWPDVAPAALISGAAGAMIPLLGGRLLAGSLVLLGQHFSGSRLRLDSVWQLFGEDGFGPISQAVTGGFEGALFGGGIVGAIWLARRRQATS